MHHVPGVGAQLVLDLGDEAGPAEQHDAVLAPEQDAQQLVEADEVVDVGVTDEHMRHAQQLARRQHGDVAQIEQQRPAFVAKVDVDAGVAECIVDETGFEQVAHESADAYRPMSSASFADPIDRAQLQCAPGLRSSDIGVRPIAVFEAREFDLRRRSAIARAFAAAGGSTLLPGFALAAPGGALPAPDRAGGLAVEQALARRRSVRRYGPQALALAAVSQLLWAAQGTSGSGGRRTAPSAGALYPLELHLVAMRVDGLATGVHRYLTATHALQSSTAGVMASDLQHAAMGQQAVGAAAAVVVITAVESRTAGKYGARAGRYVAFEAGAAAQNLALQAAALGLGTVVIGGFDETAVARVLRLPPGEQPIVLLPIGVPA